MSGSHGNISFRVRREEGDSKVRYMTVANTTCFSVRDMVKATCKKVKWGGGNRRKNVTSHLDVACQDWGAGGDLLGGYPVVFGSVSR